MNHKPVDSMSEIINDTMTALNFNNLAKETKIMVARTATGLPLPMIVANLEDRSLATITMMTRNMPWISRKG